MAGYLRDPDGIPYNAETFDFNRWLLTHDTNLLATAAGRRALTKYDPLLFAVVYLNKHLRSVATDWKVTFNDLHLELYRQARLWTIPPTAPRQNRDAYVAPRESAKTTMLFLILPLWAAAHGHIKFIAAYANTPTQAENHLGTFKKQLEKNERLREDFPDLCAPAIRERGQTVADRQNMLQTRSGFTFSASGIDKGNHGLKVDELRPELILLDDIEPGESNYSPYLADKRLTTMRDDILPLSEFARVVLVGTTTMLNSIIHQLVKARTEKNREKIPDWIKDEQFKVHHFKAIVTRPDGTERSMWPTKWPLEFLRSIRHTKSFKKNFDNDPRGTAGSLLSEDIVVARRNYSPACRPVKVAVAVDPSGGGRDVAGIIGGYLGDNGKLYFTHDRSIAGPVEEWARRVVVLAFEINAERIIVEKNYGRDLAKRNIAVAWTELHAGEKRPPPCPRIDLVWGKRGKLLRAEPIAQEIITGRIFFGAALPDLEEEWTTWKEGAGDSPGRLDASVYLGYGLLKIPGAEGVVSSPTAINAAAAAALGIGPQASMLGMPRR